MRKGVLVLILFLVFLNGKAQTGIGTTTPNASAKLDVFATDINYSAGDQLSCCSTNSGINRSARVEIYIR
jgi:hypothetical protein